MGSVMSVLVTSPVIPLFLEQRGLSPLHVGGVVGAASLSLIVSEVLALGVSSWVGRRLAVLGALVGSAAMFAWFPLTVTLVGLYVTRLALGAARGILWPVAFAEVAEAGGADQRSALFSQFWLYFGVGQLLGPATGGLLGEQVSLAAPFFAAAVVSLLTMAAAVAVRPVRDTSPNPLRSYAALLSRAPTMGRVWVATMLNTVLIGVSATFLPLHAAAHGLTTGEIGLVFTAGAVAFLIGQAALGRVGNRMSTERLLVCAYLVRGVGVAMIPLLTSFPSLLVANLLTNLGAAPIAIGLSVRVSSRAPRASTSWLRWAGSTRQRMWGFLWGQWQAASLPGGACSGRLRLRRL